jgi:hypothetical protein
MRCRVARRLFGVTVLALCSLLVPSPPAGAQPSSTSSLQSQITAAFRALRTLPPVDRGVETLEGYDPAMRTALQQAGTLLTSAGYGGKPVTVSFTTGTPDVVRADEAAVTLSITVKAKDPPPDNTDTFNAVALKVDGRWKVSWTTMCLLVESAEQVCPPTPQHLVSGDIVPSSANGLPSSAGAGAVGLVDPGSLAVASDGGVLVADDDRNQILEWRAGTLSAVVGDGLQGFSGDGGDATAAELNDPGPIAVAPDGTIYFVDRGNNRVRAVGPDGTINTVAGDGSIGLGSSPVQIDGRAATSVPLNPSSVAVSPSGIVDLASNSSILELQRGGVLSTVVAGGPPYGNDVDVGGTSEAFDPTVMAFDGVGDLDVFSFSPKELLSVDPATGEVRSIGSNYANAMAPAPDGSVLVAEHGGAPERVSGTTVTELPLSEPGRGFTTPLVADGIAEAPDGTVYVDTSSGDGFNDQRALYTVSGTTLTPVPITTTATGSMPAPGAPGFPAPTFPSSTSVRETDAALSSCPASAGLVPFTPMAEATARQMLGGWNTSFSYDLHASDRSWWPLLMATYQGGRQSVEAVTPAAHTLYAPAIAGACGQNLVADSLEIEMGPSEYSHSWEHLYLLDRDGTPLVYFSAF